MSAYASNLGADLIDVMAGGLPDDSAREWLNQKAGIARDMLTQTGQAFFNRARDLYQVVSESQTVQILRNLRSKQEDVWSSNQIQYLYRLEQLQTAGPVMQRWVMAQPDLRQRFLNQTVDGYGGQYVNYHGDAVGDAHYDYRRVVNGVVQVHEDEDRDFVIKHYYDYMREDERELSIQQRLDILNTWDIVKHMLEEGDEDPTSTHGAQL